MKNEFDGTLKSVARAEAVNRFRFNEALEEENTNLLKELEQHKAITEAAKFLVSVKRQKDTQPAQYQASMPIAWRKLEEALKNYGELEGL